MELAE